MTALTRELPRESAQPGPLDLFAGTLIAVAGNKLVVSTDAGRRTTATLGIAHRAQPGDRVVITESASQAFVVAVLGPVRPPEPPEPSGLVLSDGSRVHTADDTFRVEASDGTLLVEHGPDGTTVHGTAVRIAAHDEVHLDAKHVRIGTPESRVSLEGEALEATIERAELDIAETRFVGRLTSLVVDRARAALGVLETDAGRIVERAEQVYRDVSGLAQLRAARIRQVSEGSMTLFADRALVRANTEVDLKGDKINLG